MTLKQLLEKAEPLPWTIIDKGKAANNIHAYSIGNPNGHITYIFDDPDTALVIAHAVNMLPKLVDTLRAMQRRLDDVVNNGCCMKYADAVGGEAGVLISDREMIQNTLAEVNEPKGFKEKTTNPTITE